MKHAGWQFAVLLAIALAVRLGAGLLWQSRLDGRFCLGDSESYWRLGAAIAAGGPYEYGPQHARVFRTPGYPVLLAPIIWLFGEGRAGVAMARAEAALFGTLAVALVWWLARRLFDERAAWIAAISGSFLSGRHCLERAGSQRGPVLPLDAPAIRAVDHRLGLAESRPTRRAAASARGWPPGPPR